jgi:hypothetical protein
MVGGFAAWYGKSDRLGTDDIISWLFPVVLFWGIAWIFLGISNRKIRVIVIKSLLIGVLIVIVVVLALFTKKAEEVGTGDTPPTSLSPPRSEALREISPALEAATNMLKDAPQSSVAPQETPLRDFPDKLLFPPPQYKPKPVRR